MVYKFIVNNQQCVLGQQLGQQLRATVRIQVEPSGRERVYPWKMSNGDADSRGVMVYLEIDNRRCTTSQGMSECFPSATEVNYTIIVGYQTIIHLLIVNFGNDKPVT